MLKYFPFEFKYFFLPYPKYQFGLRPRKSKKYYVNLFNKYKKIKYPNIDKFESNFKHKIKKYIDDLHSQLKLLLKKK